MSLRYGCSRLSVLREARDCNAASDGFVSSSCGDCSWMNPERKSEPWSILIGSYMFDNFRRPIHTSDAGHAQVKVLNARHHGADI